MGELNYIFICFLSQVLHPPVRQLPGGNIIPGVSHLVPVIYVEEYSDGT